MEPISRKPPTLVTIPSAISRIFFMVLVWDYSARLSLVPTFALAGDRQIQRSCFQPRRLIERTIAKVVATCWRSWNFEKYLLPQDFPRSFPVRRLEFGTFALR